MFVKQNKAAESPKSERRFYSLIKHRLFVPRERSAQLVRFCMREFDLPTGFVFCGASADDTNFKLGDMDFVGLVRV